MFTGININITIINMKYRLFMIFSFLCDFYKFKLNAKVQKIRDTSFNYHGLYFDLQINTPILSPCLWSQLLNKLLFLSSEPTDM